MTATVTTSQAILKRRYKEGVPKLQFRKTKFMAMVSNKTDFVGDDYAIALETENPQGLGPTIALAQAALEPGKYNRFVINRRRYYGVARIDGEALRAATMRGGGALVDLWTNEMDGVSNQVLVDLEIGAFGNGSGARGQIASGQATATITLTNPTDAAKFALGMLVCAVSDTTLSPTVRGAGASAKIIGIDRTNGTLTTTGNWSTVISGATANDWLVRAGDQAAAGVHKVPAGVKQWIAGGATPGTWAGLNRNADPTRLAGQVFDATGIAMEQALIDMESLLSVQGQENELVFWTNPRDVRQIKKSLTGKTIYDRAQVTAKNGAISFQALQFEGDNGTVKILTNPFVTSGEAGLLHMPSFSLYSAGAAPMILDFDSNNFLRQSNEDAYEVRFGVYGDWGCSNPLANVRAINWGA